jgi:hypothetical protein
MDRHLCRGRDAKPDLLAADRQDGQTNVIADDDFFTGFATQNEHSWDSLRDSFDPSQSACNAYGPSQASALRLLELLILKISRFTAGKRVPLEAGLVPPKRQGASQHNSDMKS